jgi:hypothetical protein
VGDLLSNACQRQMVRLSGLVAILNRANPRHELCVQADKHQARDVQESICRTFAAEALRL